MLLVMHWHALIYMAIRNFKVRKTTAKRLQPWQRGAGVFSYCLMAAVIHAVVQALVTTTREGTGTGSVSLSLSDAISTQAWMNQIRLCRRLPNMRLDLIM